MVRKFILATCFVIASVVGNAACLAEFPKIGSIIAPALEELQQSLEETLKDKKVAVTIHDRTKLTWSWRVPAAIETEIIEQLLAKEVMAIDPDTDDRLSFLKDPSSKFAVWREQEIGDFLIEGNLQSAKEAVKLTLSVIGKERGRPLARVTVRFLKEDVQLTGNLPPLSEKTMEILKGCTGKKFGNGKTKEFPRNVLYLVGAKQPGNEIFGRELTPGEAIIPGDSVCCRNLVTGNVGFGQHYGFVKNSIETDVLKVWIQNKRIGTRVITEHVVDLSDVKSGSVRFFRLISDPKVESNPLMVFSHPYRHQEVQVDWTDTKKLDVLSTIDPFADAVVGYWHLEYGMLRGSQERNARIQLPVNLPEAWTANAEIERLDHGKAFGFVFPVGDTCTAIRIGAQDGKKTGIDAFKDFSFEDKAFNHGDRLLRNGETTKVQLKVTPNSIKLNIDGKLALNWEGNPEELRLPEELSVSNSRWLHLLADETKFRIRELTIDADSVDVKQE